MSSWEIPCISLKITYGGCCTTSQVADIRSGSAFRASCAGDVGLRQVADGWFTASGNEVSHAFEQAGVHTVRLTTVGDGGVQTTLFLDRRTRGHNCRARPESDNMECTCAPTNGRVNTVHIEPDPGLNLCVLVGDTIDSASNHSTWLVSDIRGVRSGFVDAGGEVLVDGRASSPTSCSLGIHAARLRQECHVRVLLERVEGGDVIEQEELHDATFRENELVIAFELGEVDLEDGQLLRLRLETDQLRDWHKPNTSWTMVA